jgi:hypothetical protein
MAEIQFAYADWTDSQLERELEQRYPGEKLDEALNPVINERVKKDKTFRNIPSGQHKNIARQLILRDIREKLVLLPHQRSGKQALSTEIVLVSTVHSRLG